MIQIVYLSDLSIGLYDLSIDDLDRDLSDLCVRRAKRCKGASTIPSVEAKADVFSNKGVCG